MARPISALPGPSKSRVAVIGSNRAFLAIGLGCRIEDAGTFIYADSVDLENVDAAVRIGVNCRICERMDCRQRAFPPIHHGLNIDENVRGYSAYVTPTGPAS